MMEIFNRMLHVVCVACIALTTVLFLVAIWASFDNETLWKGVASGFAVIVASLLMLGINAHVTKARDMGEAHPKQTEQ